MSTTRSLHEAAENGDLATAERLLKADPYLVGSREDYKLTPLHRAAAAGHADVVALLLANSAPVDARDYGGGTPLHLAAEYGHPEAVAALLGKKADPNVIDLEGFSPLHLAARGGHDAVAGLLLKKGADPNAQGQITGAPLHGAAERGHRSTVELLLAQGAMANGRSSGSATPWTPWHAARKAGHQELADLLSDHGGQDKAAAAITVHRAAEAGYHGRLKVLVTTEPDLVGSRDFLYRRTPLHWAALSGDRIAAEYLLAHGADIARRDKAGKTPLDLALAGGHADVAGLLRGREQGAGGASAANG